MIGIFVAIVLLYNTGLDNEIKKARAKNFSVKTEES